MGFGASKPVKFPPTATAPVSRASSFRLIPDQYKSYDELSAAMKKLGFENCEVVLAIDFTSSNREQGKRTFSGKDLHWPHESLIATPALMAAPPAYNNTGAAAPGGPPSYEGIVDIKSQMNDPKDWNPYEQVMSAMSTALEALNPAKRIHVLGFGDTLTEDHSVFCLKRRSEGELKSSIVSNLIQDCHPCYGVTEVMDAYHRALPKIIKSGPTSFVPILEAVMSRVKQTRKYCFVFIIGDGIVSDKEANAAAIVQASNYPISFSMIGVGDGGWTAAKEFDDELPERHFDNWQTVIYETKMKECNNNPLRFATHALQEAPDQLKAMRALKYIS